MDAVVVIGIGLAPSVEDDKADGLPFGELGVVGELP